MICQITHFTVELFSVCFFYNRKTRIGSNFSSGTSLDDTSRAMIRTQLTVNQCYVFSTDSIFIIPLIFTFIIAKVIMFRYLNIFIILMIAYHREIVHVIESPSKLDALTHCIKRFLNVRFFPWLSDRKKFYQTMSSNANSLECTSLLMSAVTRILEIVEFNGLKI